MWLPSPPSPRLRSRGACCLQHCRGVGGGGGSGCTPGVPAHRAGFWGGPASVSLVVRWAGGAQQDAGPGGAKKEQAGSAPMRSDAGMEILICASVSPQKPPQRPPMGPPTSPSLGAVLRGAPRGGVPAGRGGPSTARWGGGQPADPAGLEERANLDTVAAVANSRQYACSWGTVAVAKILAAV